jgi:hypothetical protein
VGSDFESSPSPETPGSPVTPSPAKNEDEEDSQKKKAKFGLKWKSKSFFCSGHRKETTVWTFYFVFAEK